MSNNINPFDVLQLTGPEIIGKSMVVYGPSGSGKSSIIRHALLQLKDLVSFPIIICPTETTSPHPSYIDIVPISCIHTSMYKPDPESNGKKKEKESDAIRRFFIELLDWQEAKCNLFNRANSKPGMMKLWNKLPRNHNKEIVYTKIQQMHKVKTKYISNLSSNHNKAQDILQIEINKIEGKYTDYVLQLIKQYIIMNRDQLGKQLLSKEELENLEYIDINKEIVLVLDDCSSELRTLAKEKRFVQLFYQGRHKGVTLIVSCHDDTDLNSNLRKNVFYSIPTSTVMAEMMILRGTFGRKSVIEQERIKKIITQIYINKGKYLTYVRDINKFYCFSPKYPIAPFKFGNRLLWDLCKEIVSDIPSIGDNKYKSLFDVNI